MSIHTSVYNRIVTYKASSLCVYFNKKVSQTTQDLLTPTLPLTISTTRVEGGKIPYPTERLCQPERKGQNKSH